MYRVRTVFTGVPGTPWYSNIFFDDQSPGGPEACVAAVAAFWAELGSGIVEAIQWEVEGDVAAISPGTGEIENVFTVPSVAGAGLSTMEPLPYANQGLVRLATGAYMGGRAIKGRIFVPGLTENASVNGTPATALVTAMEDAAQDMLDDPDTTLVVYSRKNFVQSPVTSVGAAPYWAVLRSRRD